MRQPWPAGSNLIGSHEWLSRPPAEQKNALPRDLPHCAHAFRFRKRNPQISCDARINVDYAHLRAERRACSRRLVR
jgi:hypothetical protein